MASGDIIKPSDTFNTWNTRLDNLRTIWSPSQYPVDNPNPGDLTSRTKINELINKAIDTYDSTSLKGHVKSYTEYSITTISGNPLIKWMQFDDMLSNWETCYCATNNTNSTQSTYSTNGKCGDNCTATCSTNGTNGTCSTPCTVNYT